MMRGAVMLGSGLLAGMVALTFGPAAQAVPAGDAVGGWRAELSALTLPIEQAADLLGVTYPVSPDYKVRCTTRQGFRACTFDYLAIAYTYPFTAPFATSAAGFADADAAETFLQEQGSGVGVVPRGARPGHVAVLVLDDKDPDSHVAIRHVRRGSTVLSAGCTDRGTGAKAALDCTLTLIDAMLEQRATGLRSTHMAAKPSRPAAERPTTTITLTVTGCEGCTLHPQSVLQSVAR